VLKKVNPFTYEKRVYIGKRGPVGVSRASHLKKNDPEGKSLVISPINKERGIWMEPLNLLISEEKKRGFV